jgi:hypothetical protein
MVAETEKRSELNLRLLRWVSSLIASAMIGLGLWSIATQHYFGRTTKFGGADVSLDGQPAVLMGLLFISLGALPLAFWFRTPSTAARWAAVCALAFLALLAAVLYG